MNARLINEVGTRAQLRIYWGDDCTDGSYHNATKFLADSDVQEDWGFKGDDPKAYPIDEWATHCDKCGAAVPLAGEINKQIFYRRLYNTESGSPEPGDLYLIDYLGEKMYWDNHSGPMLIAVLPDGGEWNIDSRASNCGLPQDRQHRCWVRHGTPPALHVDKNGLTCNAGAGSIISHRGWHGFLHNGVFHT